MTRSDRLCGLDLLRGDRWLDSVPLVKVDDGALAKVDHRYDQHILVVVIDAKLPQAEDLPAIGRGLVLAVIGGDDGVPNSVEPSSDPVVGEYHLDAALRQLF
jgi:hypothetical protein